MKCQDFTTAEDYQDHVEIKAGGEAEKALCSALSWPLQRGGLRGRASHGQSSWADKSKADVSAGPARVEPEDNNYLGKFVLTGLPKTLRGVPKIKADSADSDCPRPKQSQSSRRAQDAQVTFNVDSNGILEVTAEAKATGFMPLSSLCQDSARTGYEDASERRDPDHQ